MFEFGEISDIDAVRGYIKAYIPETGNTTEWIPYVRPYYAQSIPFEINEQVLVGVTGSGRWFAIGSTPNNIDTPYVGASANKFGVKFSDGCLLEYDIAAHKLTILTPGDIDITSQGNVNISALSLGVTSPDITLNGAVTVIGELSASGGISLSGGAGMKGTGGGSIITDGDVVSGIISLNSHMHDGVTSGGDNTGGPI